MSRSSLLTRSVLAGLALFLVMGGQAEAQCAGNVCTPIEDGDWNTGATWSGGNVPDCVDDSVQIYGHTIVVKQNTCAYQVIIGENPPDSRGHLMIGDGVNPVTFTMDTGTDAASTFNCNQGAMTIAAGSTVVSVSDYDGAGYAYTDMGLFEACDFNAEGQSLTVGRAETASDDGASDIVITDRNLLNLPPELNLSAMPLRVVFRSGDRKGRWYDVTSVSGQTLTIDYDSRYNEERRGNADYTTGTAELNAGGTQVTLAGGGSRQLEDVVGGLWWCTAGGDTIADAVRVRDYDSTTSFTLAEAYGGAGCGSGSPGTYVIREDNQPYPALSTEERVAPGDVYDLFTVATWRNETPGSSLNAQTGIRLSNGSCPRLHYFSCEGCGRDTNASSDDGIFNSAGITIENLNPTDCPSYLLDTIEVVDYGGLAAIELKIASNVDLDWVYVHWSSMATVANTGHGILINDNDGAGTTTNVRVRNWRVDRINDDFVWLDTMADSTYGIVVSDGIGKYAPIWDYGDSVDGVDLYNETSLGGKFLVERNVIENLGGQGTSRGVYAGSKTINAEQTVTVRDNVIANIQRGQGLGSNINGISVGNLGVENWWYVNNVLAYIEREGIAGHHHAYQNMIWRHGAIHNAAAGGGACTRMAYDLRSNFCVATPPTIAGDSTYTGIDISSGFLANEGNYAGTSTVIKDNVIFHAGYGIYDQPAGHSSATYPATADPVYTRNFLSVMPDAAFSLLGNTVGIGSRFNVASDVAGSDPTATDNVIVSIGKHNATYVVYCDSDVVGQGGDSIVTNTNGWASSRVNDNPLRTCTGTATGNAQTPMSHAGYVVALTPNSGLAEITPTDSSAPLIGPRFAGVLRSRLPIKVPGLPPNVVQGTYDTDSDGDGMIDLWDNCPFVAQTHWLDSDGDGTGDACE